MATEIGMVDFTRAWEARHLLTNPQRKHLEAWIRTARVEVPDRVRVAIQRGVDAWAESKAAEADEARQEVERLRAQLTQAGHPTTDIPALTPESQPENSSTDDNEERKGLRKLVRW